MRDIPIPYVDFEAADAQTRLQGIANIFCLPVSVMKDGNIVAIVLPKLVMPPPDYFEDDKDIPAGD
jgi:hypothetical protein